MSYIVISKSEQRGKGNFYIYRLKYNMSKVKKQRSKQNLPTPAIGIGSVDNEIQFELELCWCVQQLENALNTNKLSQKVAEDTVKNLKTLKSSTVPLIKKRQVMKSALGDYRAKMREEEKKLALVTKQIKFTATVDANKKSNFVKKSAILQSGKDFRFNFKPMENEAEEFSAEQKHAATIPGASSVGTSVILNKGFNLSSGNDFKFNFPISGSNEDLNLSELSIKS